MHELETILDSCVEEIRRGGTLEACLERYPEYRDELEALLHLALALEKRPRAQPSREATLASAIRVGRAIETGAVKHDSKQHPTRRKIVPFRMAGALRTAASIAAVLLVVVLLGSASASAVPGNLFYPLKMIREKVVFALTRTPERRVELRLTFANHRLSELVDMAADDGSIDPEVLKRLLREASLALDEARPLPDDRLSLFRDRFQAFNAYQKRILKDLSPRLPETQRPFIQKAIRMCDERDQWMRGANPKTLRAAPPERKGCWDDCGWD